MADVKGWATKSLASLLRASPGDALEIVDHILSFEDATELLDFLKQFMCSDWEDDHRIEAFVSDLFQRKGVPQDKGQDKGRGKGRGKSKGGRQDEDDYRRKTKEEHFPTMLMPMMPRDKEDKRLMVIDSASGKIPTIGNCLNCGKVIAESEGWGPCLFCGNPLEIADSFGVRSGDDRGFHDDQEFNKKFEQAIEKKKKLLEFDANSQKRTKVFDDSTDWWDQASNLWLSANQRQEAIRRGNEEEKKKREDKRKIHAKIDIFGRTVVDASAEAAAEMQKQCREDYDNWTEQVRDENRLLAMNPDHRGVGGAAQLSGESQTLFEDLRAALRSGKKPTEPASITALKDGSGVRDGEASVNSMLDFSYWSGAQYVTNIETGEYKRLDPPGAPPGDWHVVFGIGESFPCLRSKNTGEQVKLADMFPEVDWKSLYGTGSGEEAQSVMGEDKKPRYTSKNKSRVENEFTELSTSTFAAAGESAGVQLLPVAESPYADEDDKGLCLSMHQPWASLLVYGFKRAEGRSWKHDHRGRLWIHAASKAPDSAQINELEDTYRTLYESQGIPIPKMPSESSGYPTSALLGCIDMEECFSNDDYKSMLKSNPSLPPEENDNNFVFWCLRPRRLLIPIKMGGDNKIWRLPVATMRTAQGALQPVQWPMPGTGENLLTSPKVSSRPSAPSKIPAPDSPRDAPTPEKQLPSTKKNATATAKTAIAKASADQSKPRAREPSPRSVPHLDLWPSENSQETLQVLGREKDAADRDVVVLQDGFVQLVGFIPLDLQQQIIDVMRDVGISNLGFFEEQFDGVKTSKEVSRMYLGMHWNAQTQRWDAVRRGLDGESAAPIPPLLLTLYSEAVKRANRELTRGQNKKRKLRPFLENKGPDISVVNFFQPSGTMQMHQDRQESKESIDAGYPVLGICIGDSCDLAYSIEQPTQSQKPKILRLESGDVYIFGGSSRLLWHGISKVIPRSAPPSLRLLPGRLNVTLRVH